MTYTPGGGIGGDLPTVPTSVLTPDTGTGSGLTARYYKGTDPTGRKSTANRSFSFGRRITRVLSE